MSHGLEPPLHGKELCLLRSTLPRPLVKPRTTGTRVAVGKGRGCPEAEWPNLASFGKQDELSFHLRSSD